MDRSEAIEKIRRLVAAELALEPEAVTAESRLFADLAADSLDFLGLIFALEKEFGVRLRGGEFDLLSRLDLSSPEVFQDGRFTEAVLSRLRPIIPGLEAAEKAEGGVGPEQLFSLITVETLWLLLERKREAP